MVLPDVETTIPAAKKRKRQRGACPHESPEKKIESEDGNRIAYREKNIGFEHKKGIRQRHNQSRRKAQPDPIY